MRNYEFIATKINSNRRLVSINNLWGYIDQYGNEVIAPHFDSASEFDNGFAVVKITKKHIIHLRFGDATEYHNYFSIIDTNGKRIIDWDKCLKLSIVNCSNKAIIVSRYDAQPYSSCETLEQKIITLTGKIIVDYDKYSGIDFDSKTGYFKVTKNSKEGIYDIDKRAEIVSCKYDKIEFKGAHTILGVINNISGTIKIP